MRPRSVALAMVASAVTTSIRMPAPVSRLFMGPPSLLNLAKRVSCLAASRQSPPGPAAASASGDDANVRVGRPRSVGRLCQSEPMDGHLPKEILGCEVPNRTALDIRWSQDALARPRERHPGFYPPSAGNTV